MVKEEQEGPSSLTFVRETKCTVCNRWHGLWKVIGP